MGLFSGKIKTYVTSSVYNMAGDTDLRPNFLRTVLVGTTLTRSKASLGTTLVNSMLSGGGMNQRKFFRWARDSYALGLPMATLGGGANVSASVVTAGLTPLISMPAGSTLRIVSSMMDNAEVDYWAKVWVLSNHPDTPEENWTADWDAALQVITIEVNNGAGVITHSIPAPADFLWGLDQSAGSRALLYVLYNVISPDVASGLQTIGPVQLFTYRMGSGNVSFDTLVLTQISRSEFFPALPLRLNNLSIRHASKTAVYDAVAPAYKKLTQSKVDKLLDQIEDHASIADIDFCFLVQGVTLNAKDNDAKRYLYKFFENLIPDQKSTKANFDAYLNGRIDALQNSIRWGRWSMFNDADRPSREYGGAFITGPSMPVDSPVGLASPTYSELRVYAEELPEFDYRIRWLYVNETQHHGNGKTFDGVTTRGRMKIGDFWFQAGPDVVLPGLEHDDRPVLRQINAADTYEKIYLFHQHSRFAYSRLEIMGLSHMNLIYAGKSVTITGKAALADTTEESGFLVPLHYPSLREMGLLRSTQLSASSTYLVFNCYKQVKQKWWQTGFFRIIMVVAMAVLSVVFAPAAVGLSGAGILGSNLVIGTAMGFSTALSAAIAGAIVNSLAAMVMTQIIQAGAVKIFGEKFGAIIGTVVNFVAMSYANAYVSTGSFDVDWGSILRADNLLGLTNSVTGAYSAWLTAEANETYGRIQGLEGEYAERFKEIEDASKEMLGMTAAVIDPMMLTDVTEYSSETSDEFFSRTTLTGEEIAELSQALIYDFAENSLELPKIRA